MKCNCEALLAVKFKQRWARDMRIGSYRDLLSLHAYLRKLVCFRMAYLYLQDKTASNGRGRRFGYMDCRGTLDIYP